MLPIFQRIPWPFSIKEEDQACLFKFWGSNLSQLFFFFLIHFKGVVLELLAPIYKGEKRSIHSCGFFVTEESFPALDGGVDRLSTEAVHLWSDLVCPLPTQASYSSLPVLPPRRDGDATGVDLMAFQTNLISYHQNL